MYLYRYFMYNMTQLILYTHRADQHMPRYLAKFLRAGMVFCSPQYKLGEFRAALRIR